MEKMLLLREGPYAIWKEQGISQEAIEFLDSIAWGADGAVYEHKNTSENFQYISNPYLVTVKENDNILGTAVFCNPQVMVAGEPYNYYYTRYFASSPSVRGRGLVKKLAVDIMRLIRQGENRKTIFVGFIEKGNKSSYRVAEAAGYQPLGIIKTLGFSRFFPRHSNRISRISTDPEKQELLSLLREHYSRHALVQFDYLFLKDNYFVVRENGKIVAGCQYHRAHWVIHKMPGVAGKIILSVVPRIPLLNKIFNPRKFEFLAFEGIYFIPGKEKVLFELFEGLLRREKLKSALYWMAEKCPWYSRIRVAGQAGLINKFVQNSEVIIMASYQNMSDAEIERTRTSPLFASGFDYI